MPGKDVLIFEKVLILLSAFSRLMLQFLLWQALLLLLRSF